MIGIGDRVRLTDGLPLRVGEPLKRHTTLKVGGLADWYLRVNAAASEAPLIRALAWAHAEGVPVTVIGGGSNLLVADAGVRGLVVKVLAPPAPLDVDESDSNAPIVTAHAGTMISGFAEECGRQGLAGLEWAVGLPGTLGGAVANNAGAHGSDMAANFLDATLVIPEGMRRIVTADDMRFQYRHTALKDGALAGVLTTVRVRLGRGDAAALAAKAAEYHEWRKVAQPRAASAGSMFQNPSGDAAGRLIEACDLKGTRIGGAVISTVHANFFTNPDGTATAADVRALGELCRVRVREQFGIGLQYEVQRLGDWGDWGDQMAWADSDQGNESSEREGTR